MSILTQKNALTAAYFGLYVCTDLVNSYCAYPKLTFTARPERLISENYPLYTLAVFYQTITKALASRRSETYNQLLSHFLKVYFVETKRDWRDYFNHLKKPSNVREHWQRFSQENDDTIKDMQTFHAKNLQRAQIQSQRVRQHVPALVSGFGSPASADFEYQREQKQQIVSGLKANNEEKEGEAPFVIVLGDIFTSHFHSNMLGRPTHCKATAYQYYFTGAVLDSLPKTLYLNMEYIFSQLLLAKFRSGSITLDSNEIT